MVEPRLVFFLPFPLVCPTSFYPFVCPPIPMSCLVFPTCVWWLPHTNTVPCCAASSPVFSFCVSSTTITPLHPLCVKRVCARNGKEDEQTCVIQKACGKGGPKKRNRRPHVVSTPCHQPWSQPCPHTLHFTLLTTSPAFLLL